MAGKYLLVTDDIRAKGAKALRRSKTLRNVAVAMSTRLKLPIKLAYIQDIPPAPLGMRPSDLKFQAWVHENQILLDALVDAYPKGTQGFLGRGWPPQRILSLQKEGPSMVLMGTRGHFGLDRLVLGSVAEEVIRRSKVPILVVGPKAQPRKQPLTGKGKLRILVATDLGPNSRLAELKAQALARGLKAEVTLFHELASNYAIVYDAGMGAGMSGVFVPSLNDEIRKEAEEELQQKSDEFARKGVRCGFRLARTGRPAKDISKEATKGYSLVVMGTHGRSTLGAAFFGSCARQTIAASPVPVLVVRSK